MKNGLIKENCLRLSEQFNHSLGWNGRVWRSGKRLAAHAHGRWFNRAPRANQAAHLFGVGKLVPEESGRMKH
ncbi:hypothetical protein Y032_0024g956 [Ancylostoma ceylanicum]|uniref:Uncharacterized protein n=1 Tax=Ancylostoma ceylanicum TaxID=53326 RepID=A0A016UYR1_9BILA|nr:hypothetical protein Y032_0024g956 [Ancylostoma ceylanicum]